MASSRCRCTQGSRRILRATSLISRKQQSEIKRLEATHRIRRMPMEDSYQARISSKSISEVDSVSIWHKESVCKSSKPHSFVFYLFHLTLPKLYLFLEMMALNSSNNMIHMYNHAQTTKNSKGNQNIHFQQNSEQI